MTEAPDIFFWHLIQVMMIPFGVILLWRILINAIIRK